jgi:hypothetical protein
MSRARPITFGGETYWFDRHQASQKATAWQLELLAAVESVPLDDLLDEGLTQKSVLDRLREILDQGKIPEDVVQRMQRAREEALVEPECRICPPGECEGRITRHHFIPRWMMLMLENYQAYAPRRICTIPICVGRHRDLHLRGDTDTEKSIAHLLDDQERAFGEKLLSEFREQHSGVFDLIAGGDEATYEYQLVRDFMRGGFRRIVVENRSTDGVAPATMAVRT